jgi:hypothetical protein
MAKNQEQLEHIGKILHLLLNDGKTADVAFTLLVLNKSEKGLTDAKFLSNVDHDTALKVTKAVLSALTSEQVPSQVL